MLNVEVNGRRILKVGKEFLHLPKRVYEEIKELIKHIRWWYAEEYLKEKFPTIIKIFQKESESEKLKEGKLND
jgi:hypothetical protein